MLCTSVNALRSGVRETDSQELTTPNDARARTLIFKVSFRILSE